MTWCWPIRRRRLQARRRAAGSLRTRLNLESFEPRALPSFLAPVNYPTGTQSSAVAVGDFNLDGLPDLAVSNLATRPPGTVAILLGQGDGTFQPGDAYRAGTSPRFVVAGDFDGDGIPDLAVLDHVSETLPSDVQVFQGQGDGTFVATATYPVGIAAATLAVADLNLDGLPDLAVASYGSNTVSVLLNNGDGTFQDAVDYPAGASPTSVAVGDFNLDGLPDLVVTNRADRTVNVLVGNGDGSFQDPVAYADAGSQPFFVAVADLNGDGLCDLVVADRGIGATVSVFLGNGDGSFQDAVAYAAGPSPWAVTVADFNGDGLLDLAVADNGAGVSVLIGNGDGSFQAPQAFQAGSGPFDVAAGDFNGDGFPDLAVANRFSNNVSILLNDGDWSGGGNAPPAAFGRIVHAEAGELATALAPADAGHGPAVGVDLSAFATGRTVELPPRSADAATAGERVPVDHGKDETPATRSRNDMAGEPGSLDPWEHLTLDAADLRGPDSF